jgi:hypothetical protein
LKSTSPSSPNPTLVRLVKELILMLLIKIFSKIGYRLKILKFIRGMSDEHHRKVIKTSA